MSSSASPSDSTEPITPAEKDSSRTFLKHLTNIKVPLDTAKTLRIYCILTNQKVTMIATDVLEKYLASFRKDMQRWKHDRLSCESRVT